MNMCVVVFYCCTILCVVDCDVEEACQLRRKSLVIYHLTILIYHFAASSVMRSKDPHSMEFTLTHEKPGTRRLTFPRRHSRGAACELCRSDNEAFGLSTPNPRP